MTESGRRLHTGDAPGGSSPEHALIVYDTDAELVERVVAHLAGSLEGGGAAVVLATTPHRSLIELGLREVGVSPDATRLLSLDTVEALSAVVAGGTPVPARARWLLGGLVEEAPVGAGPVACYAELMVRLWQRADLSAVLALEDLWGQLASAISGLDLLCGYPAAAFPAAGDQSALAAVTDLHSGVVETAARRRLRTGSTTGHQSTSEENLSGERVDETDEPSSGAPHGSAAEDRTGPRRRREELLERIRAANQGLADELREAQSRAGDLTEENRNLRQQIRELEHRLEVHDAGDGTSTV